MEKQPKPTIIERITIWINNLNLKLQSYVIYVKMSKEDKKMLEKNKPQKIVQQNSPADSKELELKSTAQELLDSD